MKLLQMALVAALGLSMTTVAVAQGKGGGKTPPAPQGVLVDANGKTIGPFYPFPSSGRPRVLASINGNLVFISVSGQRIAGDPNREPDILKLVPRGANDNVMFEGPNCTGTGYVQTYPGVPYGASPSATLGEGFGDATLYVGANVPFLTKAVASYLNWDGICFNWSATADGLYPLIDTVPLGTVFTPPYTLR